MAEHFYSNTATVAQLATPGMDTLTVTMVVNPATWSGFPASFPFWVEIGQGTPSAEILDVQSGAGSSYTVARAQGGTSIAAHNAGDSITHIVPAIHFQDAEAHEAASTNVHGIPSGASVVGTTGSQTVKDKLFEGGHRHVYSDANPPALSYGFQVEADTADAKDGFVHNNDGADVDRRGFLLNQAGTPRVQLFNDGTVELDPNTGASRPGFKNSGTTELGDSLTLNGDLTISGTVLGNNATLSGTALIGSAAIGTASVSGDLVLPLPASPTDMSTRIAVNANASQAVLSASLNGVQNAYLDSGGNLVTSGTVSAEVLSLQGGKVLSQVTNSGNDYNLYGQFLRSDGVTTEFRNLRQPGYWGIRDSGLTHAVTATDATVWSLTFTPRDTCDIEIDLNLIFTNLAGSSGSNYEPVQGQFGFKITDVPGTTTLYASDILYPYNAQGAPTPWARGGQGQVTINSFGPTLTGGTSYVLLVHGSSPTTLKPTLNLVLGKLTESAFLGFAVNH